MFKRILTVCVGNICRSPTAEYLLRHRLGDGFNVTSAGLAGLEGKPIDATAAVLLAEHGIPADGHAGRKLTPAMLREADLVLGMEVSHLSAIAQIAPEVRGKVFLLDHWTGKRDVPDPYRQQREAFEHVYRRIDEAVQGWLPYLK